MEHQLDRVRTLKQGRAASHRTAQLDGGDVLRVIRGEAEHLLHSAPLLPALGDSVQNDLPRFERDRDALVRLAEAHRRGVREAELLLDVAARTTRLRDELRCVQPQRPVLRDGCHEATVAASSEALVKRRRLRRCGSGSGQQRQRQRAGRRTVRQRRR